MLGAGDFILECYDKIPNKALNAPLIWGLHAQFAAYFKIFLQGNWDMSVGAYIFKLIQI
jgi:hypothetical protein